MRFQNIVTIDGKELDMKDLNEKQRCEIVNRLNSRALGHLCYESEDKTA